MSLNPGIVPCQTMRGHTDWVNGIVHLPGGRRIITGSKDGSLRVWDLASGAQIGEKWKDEGKHAAVWSIALSPDGKTVASGSDGGIVRLWDIEKGEVIAKWTGHPRHVWSVCWSADSERVASGSIDGTATVWDIKRGKTVLTIQTGHAWVYAVIYSPDKTKIATGGAYNVYENAAKIWDAKRGKLLTTLKHDRLVWSLAWTSDGQKLITGSLGSIMIFDTATWLQIAVLEGHTNTVNALTLLCNDRLLASASPDSTAHLWNLDTNLPVGPPLQHKQDLTCAAFSDDGKLLVTGCDDKNAYAWDIHAILEEAGLEDLLSIPNAPKNGLKQKANALFHGASESGKEPISHSLQDIDNMSFLEADATRGADQLGDVDIGDELPPGFFDDMPADGHSSATRGAVGALLGRISSLLHRSRSDNGPHELLGRMSSLLRRFRPNTDEATEPQQPSTPSSSRLDELIGRLTSLFRSPPDTDEAIELVQRPGQNISSPSCSRHVIDVAAMRDRRPMCYSAAGTTPSACCHYIVGLSCTFALLYISSVGAKNTASARSIASRSPCPDAIITNTTYRRLDVYDTSFS